MSPPQYPAIALSGGRSGATALTGSTKRARPVSEEWSSIMSKTQTNEQTTSSPRFYKDEVSKLREQLSNLVKEVRCTIAHPARPEGLREALSQSQMLLR